MTTYDKQATIDRISDPASQGAPFAVGDVFYHPQHGNMRVKSVPGHTKGLSFNHKGESHVLKMERLYVVMAVREGKTRAERVRFVMPSEEPTP